MAMLRRSSMETIRGGSIEARAAAMTLSRVSVSGSSPSSRSTPSESVKIQSGATGVGEILAEGVADGVEVAGVEGDVRVKRSITRVSGPNLPKIVWVRLLRTASSAFCPSFAVGGRPLSVTHCPETSGCAQLAPACASASWAARSVLF